MKIIKKGKIKEKKPWWMGVYSCPLCRAEFELEEGDDKEIRLDNSMTTIVMNCPFCKNGAEMTKTIYR